MTTPVRCESTIGPFASIGTRRCVFDRGHTDRHHDGDLFWTTDQESPPHADLVNHPSHYNASPSGVECIDVVEHMPFCLGNAVKYVWRAGLKGDALTDLKKARWYLDREIARLEKAQKL